VSWRVIIRPNAEADLQDARLWYESQRTGLGDELLIEVRSAVQLLEKEPERRPIYYNGFRRLITRRFPYKIFYRVEGDRVIVFRILHANPRAFWKSRKVAEFSVRDVVVHFGQQFVQLAGGDVAFHLLIPLVVLPVAKTARDLGALFERQRGNRSLDFSHRAHAGKLSAMRFGVNAAKLD
jgi:plasmid stabilization system protein ParE